MKNATEPKYSHSDKMYVWDKKKHRPGIVLRKHCGHLKKFHCVQFGTDGPVEYIFKGRLEIITEEKFWNLIYGISSDDPYRGPYKFKVDQKKTLEGL